MNKKYLHIMITAAVAVWVFCITFAVTTKIYRNNETTTALMAPETALTSVTEEVTTQSTLPQTTEPVATVPESILTIDGNNATTNAQYTDPSWVESSKAEAESYSSALEQSKAEASSAEASRKAEEANRIQEPKTKAEIVDAYNKALNNLKQTETFTLTRKRELTVEIDSVTGGSSVEKIVQSYIDKNKNTESETYTFVNSNDSPTGESPKSILPPENAASTLTEGEVESASVESGPEGSFTITIKLPAQKQTLTTPAKTYTSCMDVLTVDSLGLTSAMSISEMDITYSSGTITARIDSSGRITSMTHDIQVSSGTGVGKITLISVNLAMHGGCVTTYVMRY